MKNTLKKILFGITLPQEYLCVNLNEYEKPLRVFCQTASSENENEISRNHLLIGYNPLVIAVDKILLKINETSDYTRASLTFESHELKMVASLYLKLNKEIKLNSTSFLIYKGEKGRQSFQNIFHRLSNNFHYKLTAKRKKNVYLKGNLFEQVKIAYSIPRKIYVASIGINNLYNIFPTDLSGPIGENNFIISLRTHGKASRQIEQAGNCIVAQMKSDSFMEVYSLGKNHMKELSELKSFGIKLKNERSQKFKLPVPLNAIQYFELEKIDKFEVGIHTIHFWKVVNSITLDKSNSVLAHIHRDIAEWRIRNSISTNYLLRK